MHRILKAKGITLLLQFNSQVAIADKLKYCRRTFPDYSGGGLQKKPVTLLNMQAANRPDDLRRTIPLLSVGGFCIPLAVYAIVNNHPLRWNNKSMSDAKPIVTLRNADDAISSSQEHSVSDPVHPFRYTHPSVKVMDAVVRVYYASDRGLHCSDSPQNTGRSTMRVEDVGGDDTQYVDTSPKRQRVERIRHGKRMDTYSSGLEFLNKIAGTFTYYANLELAWIQRFCKRQHMLLTATNSSVINHQHDSIHGPASASCS